MLIVFMVLIVFKVFTAQGANCCDSARSVLQQYVILLKSATTRCRSFNIMQKTVASHPIQISDTVCPCFIGYDF